MVRGRRVVAHAEIALVKSRALSSFVTSGYVSERVLVGILGDCIAWQSNESGFPLWITSKQSAKNCLRAVVKAN